MKKGVSIIIACYNSVSRIEPTIRHIVEQKLPANIQWQLIVVDNNSTDGTADWVAHLLEKYQITHCATLVGEARQGSRFARDTGILHSDYEYIIFCDDDNWLSQTYVHLVFQFMERNSKIAALGGKGQAACEVAPPSWFEDLVPHYAVGAQGKTSGKLEQGYLYNSGLVIRKSSYQQLKTAGFEPTLAGQVLNKVAGGEDTELILAFRLAQGEIWYQEQLTFKHFIPKARLDYTYIQKVLQERAANIFFLAPYHHHLRGIPANWIYYSIWVIKNCTLGVFTSSLKLIFGNRLAKSYARQHLGSLKYMFFHAQDYFIIRKRIAQWLNQLP